MNNVFMEIIAPNFNEIKEMFQKNINKMGLEFNEDIFMQTIEKCNRKINKDIEEKDAINYLWKAFRNNTLRELRYSRSKNVSNEIPENIIQNNYDINEDFNNISKLIINKFGEKLYQLFALHANGKPYSELQKMTTISNLKYKFRCIREYIRENYTLECD